MKKKLIVASIFYCILGFSQEKLNTLTTPTSPAASILGMQPSAQLKPKSYRALETALYSNFTDSNGNSIIPNDFGLEFMPYWAVNRGISLNDYLYPKTGMMQLVRNSSFSIATTQKFILQDSTETKSIALGYRTSLFFGNKEDQTTIEGYLTELEKQLTINNSVGKVLDKYHDTNENASKEDYIAELQRILPDVIYKELKTKSKTEATTIAEKIIEDVDALEFNNEQFDTFLESVLTITRTTIGGNYNKFKSYITARQGLAIDFASAVHVNFPDNNFEFSEVPKFAVWLSPSYNFSKEINFLKASATVRYERYFTSYFEKYFPDSVVFDHNIDYGISVAGEFKKFTIEFEATGRSSKSLIDAGQDTSGNTLYRKENSSDFQYIGTFSYRVTDQIAVSYQLGSAFKPTFNVDSGTLISLLSLNLGFGGPNKNDLKSK